MDSTLTTTANSSSSKFNNTFLHARKYASNNDNNSDSNRDNRYRSLWRRIQQLVWNQRSTKRRHQSHRHNVHSTYSRGSVSTRDCNQSCRSSGNNRNRTRNRNKLYYYIALYFLAVVPASAEDIYNTSAPSSTATGNVTNQAVQFQNNGAPSRQVYGSGISCNGSTMTLTPFYMGNEASPYNPEGYVISNNWGMQLGFMVPLDGGQVERCKSIARRQEEKLRLDYELVRALKCAELQQKGFTLRPGSRVEHLCHDVVPIALLTKQTTE